LITITAFSTQSELRESLEAGRAARDAEAAKWRREMEALHEVGLAVIESLLRTSSTLACRKTLLVCETKRRRGKQPKPRLHR
jgi:hypothetical protein